MNEAQAVESWRNLVDRLAVHGVAYLLGGSEWDGLQSAYRRPDNAPVDALLADLACAPDARLRSAIVALLLRHPEHVPIAEQIAAGLPIADPARKVLQTSVLAAAALQREWGFSLRLYLPAMDLINTDELARALDIPSPDQEYGRPCLQAAAALLRAGARFPYNYEADWEAVVHRLLVQIRREAKHGA